MSEVTVLRPGTQVQFGDGLTGRIIQVGVGDGNEVSYQIAHWDKADRKLHWVGEYELTVTGKGDRMCIGFKTDG